MSLILSRLVVSALHPFPHPTSLSVNDRRRFHHHTSRNTVSMVQMRTRRSTQSHQESPLGAVMPRSEDTSRFTPARGLPSASLAG